MNNVNKNLEMLIFLFFIFWHFFGHPNHLADDFLNLLSVSKI